MRSKNSAFPLSAGYYVRLVLLVTAALFLALAGPAVRAQEGEEIDIVVIVDNSASMCCTPPPNDPENVRLQMADLFISFLGADQSENDYRLGFVFFGSQAEATAGLTSLETIANRDSLRQQIGATRENLGWTHHQAALDTARTILQNARPGAKKAVVLLTDGEPRLADWPIQDYQTLQTDYFANMRNALESSWPDDAPIFTVAFSQEAFRRDPRSQLFKNFWEELAVNTGAPADVGYQEAVTADDLPDIYINIIRSVVGLETGVPFSPPEPSPVTKPFDVDGELAQIIVVVLKDRPEIQTTVFDPDGNQIVRTDPNVRWETGDRQDTISILDPDEGTWLVKLDGQGFIQFQAVPFPLDLEYAFNLVSPLRGHPAGKAMPIVITVNERKTGETEPLLGGSATVTYPSGAISAPLPFRPAGDDTYVAVLEDTLETGPYRLEFSGEIEAGTIHGESSVQVVPSPWLRIEQPVGQGFPSNLPLPIEAQLMWHNQPLEQIDPTWRLQASASLFDEAGNILSSPSLTAAPGGVFRGEAEPEGEGVRTIEVSLLISTAGGEQFTDVTRGNFVVGASVTLTPTPTLPPTSTPAPTGTPPPTPTPAPPPPPPNRAAIGGGLGAGLLLLAGGVGAVYVMRQPKLSGEMSVDGPSANTYVLSGRKAWTIGSDSKARIVLSGEGVAPRHAELRPHGHGVDLVDLVGDATGQPTVDGAEDLFSARPLSLEVRGENERNFQPVYNRHTLQHGDVVRLGPHTLTYHNLAQSMQSFDSGDSDSGNTDGYYDDGL